MKKRNVKRKKNWQKIFSFVSFIFILTCCFWYGGRFVYFYLDSKKVVANDDNKHLASYIINANKKSKNFKKYKDNNNDSLEYYFYGNVDNNYLRYSNIMFRIVKIDSNNLITLVTDEPITYLAYGGSNLDYDHSVIVNWLNKNNNVDNSGILENNLNGVASYLVKNSVCIDDINDAKKITCNKESESKYLGIISLDNYIKTGGKNGFLNHGISFYSSNYNQDKSIWYINSDGNLDTSDGEDILGVYATITLSPTLALKSGSGSENDPYVIEKENGVFASYVKLANDIWRVYDIDDDNVKLVLTDYIKDDNGSNLEYIYSNQTFSHNDTIWGSLAYYMNHTYLNSLSYQNIILNAYYYNGYYGSDSNFDLSNVFSSRIDTKVAVPTLGDVMFSSDLKNYFISTGLEKNGKRIYYYKENGIIGNSLVTKEANVVPCITIKKDLLVKGSGTKDDPYRTEQL